MAGRGIRLVETGRKTKDGARDLETVCVELGVSLTDSIERSGNGEHLYFDVILFFVHVYYYLQ